MLRFQRMSFVFVAAAVFLAATVMLTGCSQSPLDHGNTSNGPRLLTRSAASSAALSRSTAGDYVEQVISASDGGRLSLFDVVLDIPPGAVDNDTLFSITIPDFVVFYNEFGTSGLVFNVPVRVSMSYRDADLTGVNESTIRIGWLSEETNQWNDIVCEVDRVHKVVTGELHHFSAYGLISD